MEESLLTVDSINLCESGPVVSLPAHTLSVSSHVLTHTLIGLRTLTQLRVYEYETSIRKFFNLSRLALRCCTLVVFHASHLDFSFFAPPIRTDILILPTHLITGMGCCSSQIRVRRPNPNEVSRQVMVQFLIFIIRQSYSHSRVRQGDWPNPKICQQTGKRTSSAVPGRGNTSRSGCREGSPGQRRG